MIVTLVTLPDGARPSVWAMVAVSGVVLGAAYMLWLYQRTMFGQLTNPKNQNLKDLNARELAVLLPLIVWAFWIGLYPKPYFDILEKPVAKIVERVRPGYYAQQKSMEQNAGRHSQQGAAVEAK